MAPGICKKPSPEVAALQEISATWRFFHHLFRPATRGQFTWLGSAPPRQAWRAISGALEFDHPIELPLPGSYDVFEQEYLSTFDIGLPHPPCPLIESHWFPSEPGTAIQHEHMLYYRRLGLNLRSAENEPADHLRHQLDFLSFLAGAEAAERARGGRQEQADQLARAQMDFLQRHPARWLPRVEAAAREADVAAWARAWIGLLAAWCQPQSDGGQAVTGKE